MLFILNANKAQQDGVIAHAFGEYWKNTITKGKGLTTTATPTKHVMRTAASANWNAATVVKIRGYFRR